MKQQTKINIQTVIDDMTKAIKATQNDIAKLEAMLEDKKQLLTKLEAVKEEL